VSERRTYRFGPLEHHGFLGSIRCGQAVVVITATLGGLVMLGSSPTPTSAIGAITLIAAALVLTTVPVAGRTCEQWLPILLSWLGRRTAGQHAFRSPAPTAGFRLTAEEIVTPAEVALPGALSGVQIIELPYRGRRLGAISERGGRLLTSVLSCRVSSFSLLDPDTQERDLAHWGGVLSACSDTPIRRIQWLERSTPSEGDQLARWLEAERDPELPCRGEPMVDSYLELIERTVRVSQEHEVLIAVQVDAARVRARARDAAYGSLVEETERVADGLRRTGAQIQGGLTPSHVATLLRTAFDPYVRAALAALNDGALEQAAWPLGAVEGFDHYRTDGAVHATHWISGWPRVEVGPLFLDSLLSRCSAVRTVAVTFEPLSTDRSMREVEAQVTRDQADRALKARFGQAETARQQQAYGGTRRREAELAAGYGEVRFAGYVTVSAPEIEQLRGACAEVKRDAARARLELRPMYGQQPDAFMFTLPLCRGLR
jgi:hypothetical protein